jgi:glycerol-3-phosphate dehydrogenase
MQDKRDQLEAQCFDVLIVGAGIFGACLARCLAREGYSVALIDKGDFGSGTSANHLKFVHGGIRYLQHLDVARVRESSADRNALYRLAPHLAYPMPIVLPTYGHGRKSKGLMRAAMLAYDLLTIDRNSGIDDPERRTPRGSVWSREQVLEKFPGIPRDGLTGAAVFHDGQMYNPPRIVLAFVQSAARYGAVVANYVRADELLRAGPQVRGAKVTDVLNGRQLEINARFVVNAAGPWANRIFADGAGMGLDTEPGFSRDLCFVVRKSLCPSYGVGCPTRSKDSDALLDRGGRHLFLVPWRGMTLVGVWHGYSELHPDRIEVSLSELQAYLDEMNAAYGGLELALDDIGMVNTGLTLFGSKAAQHPGSAHSFGKRSTLYDHSRAGLNGLMTVIIVRATVARSVAEQTMRKLRSRLPTPQRAMASEWEPVHGGQFESFSALVKEIGDQLPDADPAVVRALAHNYGSDYQRVLENAGEPSLLRPLGESKVIAAEIVHAVRFELARTLEDIVMRRTELASGGDPGGGVIEQAAELAAPLLGWDKTECAAQVASVRKILQNRGPWEFHQQFEAQRVASA